MKGYHVSVIDKLCSADLVHLGMLCRRIREAHGIPLQTMAIQCGVHWATIERFELITGTTSPNTFEQYVKTLGSKDVTQSHSAITEAHKDILTTLYQRYNARKKRELLKKHQEECSLAALSFTHILPGQRNRKLDALVKQLADEERPALIMDDLWFIHAVNGTLLRLFGVDKNDQLFDQWYGWHGLANKFPKDSPIRKSHPHPDEFFSQTDTYFFEDHRTYPHLFTPQARHLICRMLQLSENEEFIFQDWWHQVTSFQLPYTEKVIPRTILSYGQEIRVYPSIVQVPPVTLGNGYTVPYALSVWDHDGSTTGKKLFETAHSDKRVSIDDILYAGHYDTKHEFHVNTWPAVKKEIAQWECS